MYEVYSITNQQGKVIYVGRCDLNGHNSVKMMTNRIARLSQEHGPVEKTVHQVYDSGTSANVAVKRLLGTVGMPSSKAVITSLPASNTRVKRIAARYGDGYPVNAFLDYSTGLRLRSVVV